MWSFAVTKVSKKRQVLRAIMRNARLSAGKTARRPDPDDGRLTHRAMAGDKSQSNTYFTKVAEIANRTAHSLYDNGFRIGDVDEFLRATIEVVGEVVAEEILDLNWKQAQVIKKLVRSCSRWAVTHFDPRKRDRHHYVGAAAHLMHQSDDKKTRQGKGGAYAATRVGERNQAKVTLAIRSALEARREPTFQEIADETGLSLTNQFISIFMLQAA